MRPLYHFTPPQNFMNDPNGLVYLDGEFHLFYQHNPFGDTWGHMSWGHAVSSDGLHWEHLPVALCEEDEIMIYSGSAVVDWQNTGGFGDGHSPAMIAIYTGHGKGLETQNIAFSIDRGRTWKKYAGNPVLDIGSDNFRDPKVFWHAPTRRWVMVVALAQERKVSFWASPDLKKWSHLSDFGPAGASRDCWECPDLFELPIALEERSTAWVLKVDSGGGQYFVGSFDGEHFTLADPKQASRWVDHGRDFYACQSWANLPPGQHRLLAWMTNWAYANVLPTFPWRGVMSVPRDLFLRRTASGLRIVQHPISVAALHQQSESWQGSVSGEQSMGLGGEAMEILSEFEPATGVEFGLKVRKGTHEETIIGYNMDRKTLFVDRAHAGQSDFFPEFAGRLEVPYPLTDHRLKLHILVDRCSVEVFANDGEMALTSLIFPTETSQGVSVYARDGQACGNVCLWSLGC